MLKREYKYLKTVAMDKHTLKQLIEMAEDGYKLSERNGAHQEFLKEDSKARNYLKQLGDGKPETTSENSLHKHVVTNSALKIEPIDTTISPQIQQFIDDMQKANEELSKAATTYLMIPAKYFGK